MDTLITLIGIDISTIFDLENAFPYIVCRLFVGFFAFLKLQLFENAWCILNGQTHI